MMRRHSLLGLLVVCCGAALALPPALQDIAQRLPDADRTRLLERQQRLSALTEAQRQALHTRVAEWDARPEAERNRRREAWQAWRDIPHAERMRMRAARASFDALPAESRQALREAFDALDANLRRGWLLGPDIGADWPRLHALLSQAPADERAPLLAALRALGGQGRDDLAVLSQRTPPEQRDALRAELLAQPAPLREAWLRRRVDP